MAKLDFGKNPVELAIEGRLIEQEQRPYLGISSIGGECLRETWFKWRWFQDVNISAKLERLYNRGHQEEEVVVKDLNAIGVVCHDVLEEQGEVVGFMGHLCGHPDGWLENVPGLDQPALLEVKTAKDRKFKEFAKFGVLRTNEGYYAQAQLYMHYKELEVCLFIVTNKDTDDRYYEFLFHDKEYCEKMEDRALDVLLSVEPPVRISERPEWYQCRYCDMKEVCHHGQRPKRNCRTCKNAIIKPDGEWHCSIWPGRAIPVDFQRTGCADHYQPIV